MSIDKQKLLEYLNGKIKESKYGKETFAYQSVLMAVTQTDLFDSPSDDRLQAALERIILTNIGNEKEIAKEALSITEPTGVERAKEAYVMVDRRVYGNGMRETVYERPNGSRFHIAMPKITYMDGGHPAAYGYDEDAEKRAADRMCSINIPDKEDTNE